MVKILGKLFFQKTKILYGIYFLHMLNFIFWKINKHLLERCQPCPIQIPLNSILYPKPLKYSKFKYIHIFMVQIFKFFVTFINFKSYNKNINKALQFKLYTI